MKLLVPVVIAASGFILASCCQSSHPDKIKQTFSSFDLPSEHAAKDMSATVTLSLQDAPIAEVLKNYEALSGRTVIHGQLPEAVISVRHATPLNRIEALQILDTALALNGVTMVLSGDNAVKAVPTSAASNESPPNITLPPELLPESSSFMSRTVPLKNLRAIYVVPMLQPLSKMPNSLVAIQSHNLLLLRDYSSNIKQQLRLLEELERKPLPEPNPQPEVRRYLEHQR
jgi:type II secretory pathway component GspD/PulD (secretin)